MSDLLEKLQGGGLNLIAEINQDPDVIAANTPAPEPAPEPDPTPEPEPKPTSDDAPDAPDTQDDDGDEDDDVSPDMPAKAGEAFKAIKGELKELKGTLSKKDEELAELRALADSKDTALKELASKIGADPDTIADAIADLTKKASVIDLEGTREYREAVTAPMEAALRSVRRVAESYDLDENKLIAALHEPSRRKQSEMLDELTADLPQRDASMIFRAAEDVELVLEKKRELEESAETNLSQIRASMAANEEAAQKKRAESVLGHANQISGQLKEKLPGFEDAISDALKKARTELSTGIKDSTLAYAAVSGFLIPDIFAKYQEAEKQVKELQATVERYTKASPSGGRPSGDKPSLDSRPLAERLSAVEGVNLLDGIFKR